MAKTEGSAPANFEKELARLEEIVSKLEAGSLGLDESIALYEEGARCLKACQGRLAQAEARIKMLVEGAEGPEERDFDPAAAEDKPAAGGPRGGRKTESDASDTSDESDASGEPAPAKPRRRAREPRGRGLF